MTKHEKEIAIIEEIKKIPTAEKGCRCDVNEDGLRDRVGLQLAIMKVMRYEFKMVDDVAVYSYDVGSNCREIIRRMEEKGIIKFNGEWRTMFKLIVEEV